MTFLVFGEGLSFSEKFEIFVGGGVPIEEKIEKKVWVGGLPKVLFARSKVGRRKERKLNE